MISQELQATLARNTVKANQAFCQGLALNDPKDIEAATRGFVASLPEGGVLAANGNVAWDISKFDFLKGECPDTVNPSLWRQGQLNAHSGLFKVVDGVWQARACDYANMTIIQGKQGFILIDPLMAAEAAAAALALARRELGNQPVSAILITHTHPDHFAGIKGVVDDPENPPAVYAPAGFMEYAASEGVLGGNHTSRRAMYQFGLLLKEDATGLVDGGIGKTVAKGSRTFVAPTVFVQEDGESHVIDGVTVEFQIASGTEAPAEFTLYLPEQRVLCMAEVCNQTMHNVLTPRGAQVRDSLLWARVIDDAARRYANRTDVLVNSHNWPVWGTAEVVRYLEEQRDIYKYIHDQSLRLANLGHTPHEIAALIQEPEWLSQGMHARGYYGTLKFNARAVYQMYYGWFDGHPVNLDPLPPTELGQNWVQALGGIERTIEVATQAIESDQLQWAATVLYYALFSGLAEDDSTIKRLFAEVLKHQGYRAESGIHRNIYLVGAKELEQGVNPLPMTGGRNSDLAATLSLKDWLDAYALRLNPGKAVGVDLVINLQVDSQQACVSVKRQTEFARMEHQAPNADVTISTNKTILEALASGTASLSELADNQIQISGREAAVQEWMQLHENFNLWFNVVTP